MITISLLELSHYQYMAIKMHMCSPATISQRRRPSTTTTITITWWIDNGRARSYANVVRFDNTTI